MSIISIDIQPQYRFACSAPNEQRFLHQPEKIVKELNNQAQFANKRLLIENISTSFNSLCPRYINNNPNRNGLTFDRQKSFGNCTDGCRSTYLLHGLPSPADYDHSIEINSDYRQGTCFHDEQESRSTGLIEWLRQQSAQTVIIGGLAIEEAVSFTAKQLNSYNRGLNIIINLAACCGYTPESTIQTIYHMKNMGISIATDTNNVSELVHNFVREPLYKVS